MHRQTILWQNLHSPGHEMAILTLDDTASLSLTGSAIFLYEQSPCQLTYTVACAVNGETVAASVEGWLGPKPIAIEVRAEQREWFLNGVPQPQLSGCQDLDLAFSPVTNTLPIRRAKLMAGQQIDTMAAWLRFPTFAIEPLAQTYTCISPTHYRYESGGGRFVSNIKFNQFGLVTHYPDLWRQVTNAPIE